MPPARGWGWLGRPPPGNGGGAPEVLAAGRAAARGGGGGTVDARRGGGRCGEAGAARGGPRPLVKPMGVRASLYPIVKDLEMDWMDRPERAAEIVELIAGLAAGELKLAPAIDNILGHFEKWLFALDPHAIDQHIDAAQLSDGLINDDANLRWPAGIRAGADFVMPTMD